MIAVIAELTVQDGKGAEFEAVVAELEEQVKLNEPGTQLYKLARSKEDPNSYRIIELYKDQEALDAHSKSAHFQAAGQRLAALLGGAPKIEFFDAL